MNRRHFIAGSAATALAATTAIAQADQWLTIGVFTDPHYADKDTWGTRHYRDSLAKLRHCVRTFRERNVDFSVHLGDLVDKADSVKEELAWLEAIRDVYAETNSERHYVLGNHDLGTFTKRQFLDAVGQEHPFYSFDRGAFHFVVLDACHLQDGTDYAAGNFAWTDAYVSEAELEWLRNDLQRTSKPTIVMVHQRLDGGDQHKVKNADDVRTCLNTSGKVIGVFQGHHHTGDYRQIQAIHYYTFKAMVEGPGEANNAYAVVRLDPAGAIQVRGFGQQPSYEHTFAVPGGA